METLVSRRFAAGSKASSRNQRKLSPGEIPRLPWRRLLGPAPSITGHAEVVSAAAALKVLVMSQYASMLTLAAEGASYLADGLHPNALGHQAMARHLIATICGEGAAGWRNGSQGSVEVCHAAIYDRALSEVELQQVAAQMRAYQLRRYGRVI